MMTKFRIPQTILDTKGRAKVWHTQKKEWVWLSPVDAEEALHIGLCSLNDDGSNQYDVNPEKKPLDSLGLPELREMLVGFGYKTDEVNRQRKQTLIEMIELERDTHNDEEDEVAA